MDKMNLAEATMLALQGKLELKESKDNKIESVDITANDTFVSINDDTTTISSPEASVTIKNDSDTEEVVELPVESNETVIPEEIIDDENITTDILPDEKSDEDTIVTESVDTTNNIDVTKYPEVKDLATDIANSLKDKEKITLNDVIEAIENWDNGDTSVFTVIAKVDDDLYKKLDDHNTENEDNRYEAENQFLGLVEDYLSDMDKTIFDDDYYAENKKIESVKNAYTFEELAEDIDDALTYEDLYSCLLHIKNQNLRNRAYDHVEQSEKDGDSVKEAGSMLMSDVLERYRYKDNVSNLKESVVNMKNEGLNSTPSFYNDIEDTLIKFKEAQLMAHKDDKEQCILSTNTFLDSIINMCNNLKESSVATITESEKLQEDISAAPFRDLMYDCLNDDIEPAETMANRMLKAWSDDDCKGYCEEYELVEPYNDFSDEEHYYKDVYGNIRDKSGQITGEADELDESKKTAMPKVNVKTFESKLSNIYKKDVKLEAVYMSNDGIKLDGTIAISDKATRKLQLEMKQIKTFNNKTTYAVTSTGRSIKTESNRPQMIMTISNKNNVLECDNILNRKNK